MKLLKNKKFYASVLIDFSFLTVLYLFLLFIIRKVKDYAYVLQGFGNNLASMESVIQNNLSAVDYSLLLNNIDVINQAAKKILLLFIILLIGSFWIYIVFQSVQWSLILNKFKNFRKYFVKFSLASLFVFSLAVLFLWYALLNARNIILNFLMSEPTSGIFAKLIVLYALLFLLGYYATVCYILLSKYKTLEALKKTFLFNHIKSMLIYLTCFILTIAIIILWPTLGLFDLYWVILEVLLILIIVNLFRYYLVRILKKY